MGSAAIEGSPFIFVILVGQKKLMSGWLLYQGEMLAFLVVSIVAILLIIMWITTGWVHRLKESDLHREATLHNVEHTNRMASIGRLAAGVAHEINNPLAIINEKAGLITDILGSSPGTPQKEKLLQQTGSIIKSVTRCSEITHRLLGFARHMDTKHEPIVIDKLIREVLGFLEKEAIFRDIRIEMTVADSLPTVHSDQGQMQQLFLNLINNAFDAMEKGGCLRIDIRGLKPGRVSVTIEDDGIGISQANLENIFEPFFTTKKSHGTGLGLSITYGIVKKLKGTIEVESEVGKGTRFTINLPAGPMREHFRVLIVDDEDDLLSTLVERLEFRGIETVGVQTGEQALAKIREQEFGVVVQDVKLKGEDGIEVMKLIKKLRPELPVILLTGHMSPESSRDGIQAGATDYLLKPINLEDLIVKMEDAITANRRGEN